MITATRHFLLFLSLAVLCAADSVKVRPGSWAQPVIASSLGNFYRVSEELYRSEQPKAADIPDLKAFGIRTVFSLRHYYHDSRAFERAGISAIQYQMDAGSVSVADLIAVLRLMRTAPKPILLHCWHGSDRTGFIVAGYRMVFMSWSPADAIEELRLGGFGHHESSYPNIARVLREMDVSEVRAAVFFNNVVPNPPLPPTAGVGGQAMPLERAGQNMPDGSGGDLRLPRR
jgi:protein tyrosine phosphatase (PTP) superfamily phosphohydrolase (DUF442 family)